MSFKVVKKQHDGKVETVFNPLVYKLSEEDLGIVN